MSGNEEKTTKQLTKQPTKQPTEQIYTPPAPNNEVYSDEELQAIVEGSTWVHLRALAAEVLQTRSALEELESTTIPSLTKDMMWWREATYQKEYERNEARQWAIKLRQDNKRLLSRVGELEVELEEIKIERDALKEAPNVIIYGGTVQEILEQLSKNNADH